jgi:cytochrome c-type biogenesis protein
MEVMAFLEQMGSSNMAIVAAFFIGLMTAVSPCPVATNITAIAYVSRRIENNKHTVLVGFLYTMGRAVAYIGLASLIVYTGLNTQQVALFLQAYGEKLLGPFLIIIGLVMLEAVKFNFIKGGNRINDLKTKLADKGYLGGFLLGGIFALTFCPFSAVLYFGMLIPLALKTNDAFIVPLVFAIATGLPVIVASILLVKSVSTLGRLMNKVQTFEKIMRKFVGVVFIFIGAYYVMMILF